MYMKKIPVAGPSITQKEVDLVADAAANGWYENANRYNALFEEKFAEYIGVRFAVSLPSCTSAIHLSLAALGIGAGDEVIVPDITWIASASPVMYVGALPIFADIDQKTWCLSAESFEASITENTRAVIVVDLYGGMPEIDRIVGIAQRHGIAVIEDAAEAIGSEFEQRKAGSFGDTGVFSFHGSKTLTTGEGGMLVTNREDLYERVLMLRDHGRSRGDKMFWNTEVAYKYKMSGLQAAMGLAQLERVDELVHRKREIFSWYYEALNDMEGVTLNEEPVPVKNSYWMVTAVLDNDFGIQKEDLIAAMGARNIDCRPFFYPLSSLPAFATLADVCRYNAMNRNSYLISPRGINLPSGFNLDRSSVSYIAGSLKQIIASK